MAAASRERGANQPPDNARFHTDLSHAFHELYADLPVRERQARALAWALERLPVYLFPEERLVGMVYHRGEPPTVANPLDYNPWACEETRRRLPDNEELVELRLVTPGAAPGHVTWHWDWILGRGVLGLLGDHRRALDAATGDRAGDFHRGVILRLEALLAWNRRHVAALRAALAEAGDDERPRLAMLADLCERVPAHPARSFHEAVQSFYFQYLGVMRENPHGGNGPGRLDYFLWPYLERDLEAGTMALDDARELVDELFVRLHERILDADGWVETIVVGGCHPDGSSAVNPLSHIMVESIMALGQSHPSVYLRMPADPPDGFVRLGVRYLLEGGNLGLILNDSAIIAAMQTGGMPAEDASMYTCGGCMEIGPQGMQSDLLYAAYHNVPKVVELALTGGECLRTGRRLAAVDLPPLAAHASFEDLYAVFAAELRRELEVLFRRVDLFGESMAAHRPAYLLSSMVGDCLARGLELQDGGARYPDYGFTPLGIPNAGDALYAVKGAVFDDGFCTGEELLAALRANFDGHEALRVRLRALPKYGQQHPEADAMTDRVLGEVCGIYQSYRNRWGGRAKPVIMTFVWAPEAGAALGATAYGDFAGKPIAQSLTPQSMAMTQGLTAAIASHTSLCLERVTGGASSMWDLDPQWASPETVEAVLRTFLRLGGHIFQGNMTDVARLLEARECPEDYPNLMVRVGGFSARFVTLGPALQDEIIHRYRHAG